ncbi:molybdopterin-dependent oxidoreductase [Curtanaerobium respiraculi]|uniref:molybdopterin-dependent oxidoreductase n=1 Tax=Curtanaerobium respiraculi TaxID=2949669 RepID=UPI0024B38BC0|nr:molybdopterin-dependent oxidoreductase [Curtanaerobium respiraculi]
MRENVQSPMTSRRGFVKGIAAGAAGLAAAGAMASASGWLAPAKAHAEAEEKVAYTYHNEHCLCNCMLECTVRDGRLIKLEPRPNEDKRFHNICLKGISEIQHIYGEARLQRPMKRVGERGSGEFEAITWDEAFQMIADNFKGAQEKYGRESLWIQYSTEAQQRFTPLLSSVLGAHAGGLNGYDMGQGNGQGQGMGFSGMFAMNTVWEWPQAKVVLMVNHNMVETSMMWSRAMLDAKEAGTKIICIDPRFSQTAGKASQWVNLRPGTDPAFFLGMIRYILDKKLYSEAHLLAHTSFPFLVDAETGEVLGDVAQAENPISGQMMPVKPAPYVWDTASNAAVPCNTPGASPALQGTFAVNGRTYVTEFTRLLEETRMYTLDWAEKTCGVGADVIAQVATEYAEGPSIIDNGVGGIDKFGNNDIAGHCYALIASLTDNYGKRGTGIGIYGYHVTPYSVNMGPWLPTANREPAKSPMGFYDMVQKDDSIHAAMFFGDIPTQKAANWSKTLEWIDSLDFICLADIYQSSVTDYVDLVLPVCSKFECADEVGGVKCANGYILENQKVLDPLFEAKSDFYIEKGIAEAMGLGDLYPADGEEFARAMLQSGDPMTEGFTLEKLAEAKGALKLLGTDDPLGPEVGYTLGTPSTRQEPYYENLLSWGQAFPAWEAPNEAYPENPLREKYPLAFTQSRTRFRVHSAYSGANWVQQIFEPHIEMNPADAKARGLESGDKVEVFNDRGSFKTKLLVNNAVRPETAFMAESTYRQYLDGTLMQSVTNDTLNPRGYALNFGPMIPFNDTLIDIKKAGE